MLTEDEAEFLLKELIQKEQRRLQTILKPYFAELCELGSRKPPRSIDMGDGKFAVYIGPTATDMAGPYKVPRWLDELATQDNDLVNALNYYRRQIA